MDFSGLAPAAGAAPGRRRRALAIVAGVLHVSSVVSPPLCPPCTANYPPPPSFTLLLPWTRLPAESLPQAAARAPRQGMCVTVTDTLLHLSSPHHPLFPFSLFSLVGVFSVPWQSALRQWRSPPLWFCRRDILARSVSFCSVFVVAGQDPDWLPRRVQFFLNITRWKCEPHWWGLQARAAAEVNSYRRVTYVRAAAAVILALVPRQ